MERETLSYCRICAAACGIVVTVDGDQVVRVRGDGGHPVSRGYTCSKGRGLADWHHSPARLDRPRLHGHDVSWADLLDDLGAVVRDTIAGPGADAIALYLATGMAYDAAGQIAAGSFLGALGSRSFYTAVTVDNAPVLVAAELVTGNAMMNPTWDPTTPGLLVLVGTNPVISHGYGTTMPDPVQYLRDYRASGGKVWVLDPRRTETASLADAHLATRPGSDVVILAALAAGLLDNGADERELRDFCAPGDVVELRRALAPFTLDRAAAAADVGVAALDDLLRAMRESRGRIAVACGTGALMGVDGILVEWLRWVLLIVSGSLDRRGGMRVPRGGLFHLRPPHPPRPPTPPAPGPPSRPELPRVVDQLPVVALADEIDSGAVRILVVTGGNPIAAAPEPARMRAALERLDALVVVDVIESELTDLATHVLPATGELERADISMYAHFSVHPAMQSTPAIVAPVGDRRPVWWMLASLASRAGVDVLGGTDPDTITDETYLSGVLEHSPLDASRVLTIGPRGFDLPVEYGWVRESMLPDGRWHIAPPVMLDRLLTHAASGAGLLLTPHRQMGWSNSVRYGAHGDPDDPRLLVHPDDAEAVGVRDGGRARVATAHGSIELVVTVDERIRAGVVSFTHGRRGTSPGELLSTRDAVDPLTTMPRASGVPVTVTAVPM